MPKGYKNPCSDPNDPEYIAKRLRNNEAIRRTREKARMRTEETKNRVEELKEDIYEKRLAIRHIAESFDLTEKVYKGDFYLLKILQWNGYYSAPRAKRGGPNKLKRMALTRSDFVGK